MTQLMADILHTGAISFVSSIIGGCVEQWRCQKYIIKPMREEADKLLKENLKLDGENKELRWMNQGKNYENEYLRRTLAATRKAMETPKEEPKTK